MSAVARGRALEALARHHLEQQGLRFLSQNFRCPGGELDLVMQEHDTVIFVEVRGRRNNRYGSAAESIDGAKQARLVRAAQRFLQRNPELARRPCRFDVVTVTGAVATHLQLEWIRDAFAAC